MPIFTRRRNETIVCTLPDGERIEFTFFGVIGRDLIKVKVVAPPDVKINRGEVQERIDQSGERQ